MLNFIIKERTGPATDLVISVVHGGDEALRARSAAIKAVVNSTYYKTKEVLDIRTDLVIVFSWARTKGRDQPSEARRMYEIFIKRLRVLSEAGKVNGKITEPESIENKNHWTISLGDREIEIHLEEESVDTEDNAEKSVKILQEIADRKKYDKIRLCPISSDFHTLRLNEAYGRQKRHVYTESAEDILTSHWKSFWDKYVKYGELKAKSIPMKTKILEIALRVASRTEKGRKIIRNHTRRRVEE